MFYLKTLENSALFPRCI